MATQEPALPTFAETVCRLLDVIGQRGSHHEPYSRIEVAEVDLSDAQGPVMDGPRIEAAFYEQRWSHILEFVDRDWVNVHACGVQERALVLAVEWFPPAGGSDRRPGPKQVCVMVSGHQGPYRWAWG